VFVGKVQLLAPSIFLTNDAAKYGVTTAKTDSRSFDILNATKANWKAHIYRVCQKMTQLVFVRTS